MISQLLLAHMLINEKKISCVAQIPIAVAQCVLVYPGLFDSSFLPSQPLVASPKHTLLSGLMMFPISLPHVGPSLSITDLLTLSHVNSFLSGELMVHIRKMGKSHYLAV